ncbi:GDSL-type esterase/lipase family protein [Sporolactobacillus kofuensis]|uniref:GDSL-type esterase/lipase family protein n=1 Tax=Sporolactobacillus kofuensis TaxID=269672 RepID=A0ABW1WE49_9BACL|nr:GDSL-type esterase/lipase family protein [Sporolactobacillus kofuensis]MCO7175876.1 GDSL-type esterase/lipase family protein [Sporolactobacillus kofuensis]
MQQIICFGDSITAGWNGTQETRALTERLEQGLNCRVVNAGVPGETTRQARHRLQKLPIASSRMTIILFGSNDASFHKGIPVEEFQENLITFIERIHPNRCLLVTPPPVIEMKQEGKRKNTCINQYATSVRKIARSMNVALVDLNRQMSEHNNLSQLLLEDGLHLSSSGYDLFALLLINQVKQFEKKTKKDKM